VLISIAQSPVESVGQASVWTLASPEQTAAWVAGFRFLPGLRYSGHRSAMQLGAEASVYLHAHQTLIPFADTPRAGLQPYRLWIRMADSCRSLRIGLQQINFGSATLLRPLMWFDRVDPLDPLGITEGVWSALVQVYFGQKSNVWLWVNFPGEKIRVWDIFPSQKYFPELGSRFQWAVPKGEMGVAANLRSVSTGVTLKSQAPGKLGYLNYSLGLDGKWDVGPGLWYEFSLKGVDRSFGIFSHFALLTLGADYTFQIGNGLNLMAEHLLSAAGSRLSSMPNNAAFTALSATYALDFFDQLRLIAYYDWKNENTYVFILYEHSLPQGKLQFMGWANPKNPTLPGRDNLDLFGGTGAQLMYIVHF
jgi:hypothetical protein